MIHSLITQVITRFSCIILIKNSKIHNTKYIITNKLTQMSTQGCMLYSVLYNNVYRLQKIKEKKIKPKEEINGG